MQYNIFKVNEIASLKKDMFERNFEMIGEEIQSEKYKLNLFCKYDDDLKLSWKNIFLEFGENIIPKRTGISSIILCESNDMNYAITYGTSSFLVQKYCDKEFGFNFAKRIGLKEMKRKSSMIPHSTKNSSITSFKNTKTILFDSGENITSLSFSPQDEFYGKRIDIGKSIKLNVDISLKDINMLFEKIEMDMSNQIINNIPLLTKITNKESIEKYNTIMYEDLENECNMSKNINLSNFSINEFYIVGSSIYFEEEHTQIVKIGRIEEEIELHSLNDLIVLSNKHNISIKQIIEKGKIVYRDLSNQNIYSENIRKFITYEIESENVSLYNDDWYYYNSDYYDLIINDVKEIDVVYDESSDYSKSEIENNRKEKKEYRELILNRMLCSKYSGKLLDRDLFISKYEGDFFDSQYKVELADLLIEDEYISVKIGTTQTFSYCVDQSELAAKLINAKVLDLDERGLKEPKKYGVWFYFENKSIFNGSNVEIEKIHSIMLLSKLSSWSKNIKLYGKTPVIHVNKYEK